MTKVVNVKTDTFDIYIGRGKGDTLYHFGNPFTHLPLERTKAEVMVESRDEAVRRYGTWLRGESDTDLLPDRRQWILGNLHKLKDKTLGCWCAPLSCHGDILKEMIEETNNGTQVA